MKAVTKIMMAGAGLAAMTAAAPAAAQYGYPGGSYGGYPGYGYGNNGAGVIGSILNQILGGRANSYGVNDRQAVEQCVRAVEHRINTRGFDNEGGRYRQYGYGYGYNNGYGYGYQQQADARFDCTVDRYGRITDIDANRNYANNNYPYRR
jgi:hypothetical protein